MLTDERRHALFRIHLGFQPSASSSHRCGGEIEKQRLLRFLRTLHRRVDVVGPLNLCHELLPRFLGRNSRARRSGQASQLSKLNVKVSPPPPPPRPPLPPNGGKGDSYLLSPRPPCAGG